ncbi:phage/plasmid replication protein, II/X family [Pseudomonas aeruginosa]|uniref:phage/plasmid replication protein, II/X family n=1 Tax=Pseudomonas aeruginosa TaxID=287 RepID=UPI0021C98506|nr:phage/plasmid replication protein, II/X family [Pseudomonas aeruginosa]MDS9606209.1 phage/plasmid replication protein, II/X family [Pseudomonas aeruginosa]MDS9694457.1 phage/plasmid replication protein, II/X family [Pseudomonas aeruginosa]MDS9872958.1 phage/plasmid replication protein, II/X family [Pseudomonas aeruginosa]WNO95395.1 phage/plasmid replication protein, II/X family [Pseudomonas aeruginosa]WNO95409.1 phage/plasmid replication protein, II/X family [Pseudomonas aeruginosa]
MIDWIAAMIELHHAPLSSGAVVCIEADGTVAWETPRKMLVRGSHDSTIHIRSVGGDGQGSATHLYIDGNPSKWLQGHNLVGSCDLVALVWDAFQRLCALVGLEPTDFERQKVRAGQYRVTRVDYNRMFELPSRADVRAWLRAGEFKCKSRHGRPVNNRGTLTFGKGSSHWSIVCYCKADEITSGGSHKLPEEFHQYPEIYQWIDNKLRVELRLRSKKLKALNLEYASQLTPTVLWKLYRDFIGELDMSEQIELKSDEVMNLPNWLRGTYMLWKQGHDLRDSLSKATYYRHRTELLALGIDINIRCDRRDDSNVVPMIRILEAKPAAIPNFFFERGLIHKSARQVAV